MMPRRTTCRPRATRSRCGRGSVCSRTRSVSAKANTSCARSRTVRTAFKASSSRGGCRAGGLRWRPARRALRRNGRRLGVRRLGDGVQAVGGGHAGVPARARQGVPARVVSAQPMGHEPKPLGPERGPARALQRVGVPRSRRDRRQRARGRFAALLERPHPQGRARRSYARTSSTADGSTGRSATRISSRTTTPRGDARREAVPARAPALRAGRTR